VEGRTYAGNSLLGSIIIGSTDASGQVVTQMPAAGGKAWLVMEGNGYWASETQIVANGVLVFRGEGSRNIEAGLTRASDSDGQGADSLSGCGVVAVSDVDATTAEMETGTVAHFATLDGYSGDIVAEGALATFEVDAVKGNAYSGGSISISGEGAKVDLLAGTHVSIMDGKRLSFTSTAGRGTYAHKNGASILVADRVSVAKGGTLSVSHQQTEYHYSDDSRSTNLETLADAATLSEKEMLPVFQTEEYAYYAYGKDAVGYPEHFDASIAVNQTRVGDAQLTSLTMESGSTYEVNEGNTSLHGGSLTLDATTEKIKLGLNGLENMEGKTQVVLFSDVESICFKINSSGQEVWAEALTGEETLNRIYAFSASDLFELYGSGVNLVGLNPTIVYDAGSKVVYLDYIPEPATTTLSLLALAALCSRRRRK